MATNVGWKDEAMAAKDALHGPGRRQLEELVERLRASSPPRGPGWSVSFRDAAGEVVAMCSLATYDQVDALTGEAEALGYTLSPSNPHRDCDFLFIPSSAAAPPVARPARPAMPAGSRLPIARGDLVMEDCGGPIMLVHSLAADLAYCVWFSEEAAMRNGTFTVSRLVNVGGARRRLQALAGEATPRRH